MIKKSESNFPLSGNYHVKPESEHLRG